MQEEHYKVPQHDEGTRGAITYAIEEETIEDAEDLFVDAKDRMLDINHWNKFSNVDSGSFRLTDHNGHEVFRHARRGDHVFTGSPAEVESGSVDWLYVSALEYDDYPDENKETFAIKLQPSPKPDGESVFESTPDDPTTSITLARSGNKVTVTLELAQNNTAHDLVATVWSDAQWSALMEGLLEYFGE